MAVSCFELSIPIVPADSNMVSMTEEECGSCVTVVPPIFALPSIVLIFDGGVVVDMAIGGFSTAPLPAEFRPSKLLLLLQQQHSIISVDDNIVDDTNGPPPPAADAYCRLRSLTIRSSGDNVVVFIAVVEVVAVAPNRW